MSEPRDEIGEKEAHVRAFLEREGFGGVLLASPLYFAWITGGGENHVDLAGAEPRAAAAVTLQGSTLLVDPSSAPLLPTPLSWAAFTYDGDQGLRTDRLPPRTGTGEWCSDLPLPGVAPLPASFAALTRLLAPAEVERYRQLAEDVAVCVTQTCFHLRPGLSEQAIAGMLAGWLHGLGVTPVRLGVAVDHRAEWVRDPVPTAERLEQRVRISLRARRHGLHVSLTRLVQFMPLDEQTRAQQREAQQAAARALPSPANLAPALHEPDVPVTLMLQGYLPRPLADWDAPGEREAFSCRAGAGFCQCEDTYLLTGDDMELLTATPDLPSVRVLAGGQSVVVPSILSR